jgi:putative PIN family toxin of toxin-antitoxin system
MRIVIDTVVLVRGLINPKSYCGRLVFDHFDEYKLVVSSETIAEYLSVIQRPELQRKYRESSTRSIDVVVDKIASATIVEPVDVPRVCRDPSDDKFLAAALVGNAEFIVSEDKDLLDLGSYEGIEICTVEAFLRQLGQ